MAEKINNKTILTSKPKSVQQVNSEFYKSNDHKRKVRSPNHVKQTKPESKEGSRGYANPANLSDRDDFNPHAGKYLRSGEMLKDVARREAVKAANRDGKKLAKKGK